ncbi:hypothetical protein [Leifsonia xyli]|uniref:hypothetical protein n=1 Tax=Leifsonia xyli TaxID=1575 RepID=UPI003D66663D
MSELLESLAYTEPLRCEALVECILDRLAALDGQEADGEPTDRDRQRAEWGLPAIGRFDVEQKLPRPLGISARQDDSLLPAALELLWMLRLNDSRRPHSHPESAARVLADDVANLGTMDHPSVAKNIVGWVFDAVVRHPARGDDVVSVFELLDPLLAKEGYRTVAVDSKSIAFRPYFVAAAWAKPHRDAIRTGFRDAWARLGGLDRAAAIRELSNALRIPHGLFGATVPEEVLHAWQTDDLATIQLLDELAHGGASAIERQMIRNAVRWDAERAPSMPVRFAALRLVNTIDQDRDCLAELLVSGPRDEAPLPTAAETFDEFLASPAAAEASEFDSDEWSRNYERRRSAHLAGVVKQLFSDGVESAVSELKAESSLATQSGMDPAGGLQALGLFLLRERPALAAGIARHVVSSTDMEPFVQILPFFSKDGDGMTRRACWIGLRTIPLSRPRSGR